MPSTFDFCIPTRSTSVPDTPDWLHEIKYRLRLERDGDRVRCSLGTAMTGRIATR
jgi:bifunctional non-homologous end joining protein LigD